jgi:hypothetical protein
MTLSCPSGGAAPPQAPVLPFVAPATDNGVDASGNPIHGFCWWTAGSPASVDTGPGAAASFKAAASLSVDFGGTLGVLPATVTTHAIWADPANPDGWSAQWSILERTPLPAGTAESPWVSAGTYGTFALTLPGATKAVTVDVDASSRVFDVQEGDPQVPGANIHPILARMDLSTPSGQSWIVQTLVQGAPVQVWGFPTAQGHLLAETLFVLLH